MAKRKGTFGEDFAAEKLTQAGYEILERNWRWGSYEIDLIAQKEDTIAFVEVKTRSQDSLSPAAPTKAQQKRILMAAASYLRQKNIYDTGTVQPRFDLFQIFTSHGDTGPVLRWEHLTSAFTAQDTGLFL